MDRRRSTRLAGLQSTRVELPVLSGPEVVVDTAPIDDNSDSELTPVEDSPKTKRTKKTTAKRKQGSKIPNNGGDEDFDPSDDAEASPKKRKRAPKPEPIYTIPDVEKRTTTFKGRLGYACLNTVLRNKKPAIDAVFCSRTCRLDTVNQKGIEFAKELGVKNVEDLLTIIQWNEDNNIRFMRISSELFPYASHGIHRYSLAFCAPLLARVGELASKYNHRLTTHPGQYTQLGSPKPAVIAAAVRELEYHCEMLDLMGIGKDGVMIVHGGGMYGDKPSTIERIKKTITEVLPQNVRDRLVLENDEFCYTAGDLLPLCEALQVPLVFDYHHDALNPSEIPRTEIIARANAIFKQRGIKPKQHLSEARKGAETITEKRKHSARCERLPDELDDDMDLMIEAKDKEQAVLQLFRIYDLQPVIQGSLRPASDDSKQVQEARDNRKKPRRKAIKDEDECDGEIEGKDDIGLESQNGEMKTFTELIPTAEDEMNIDGEVFAMEQPEEVTTQVMREAKNIGMDICQQASEDGKKRRSPRKKSLKRSI